MDKKEQAPILVKKLMTHLYNRDSKRILEVRSQFLKIGREASAELISQIRNLATQEISESQHLFIFSGLCLLLVDLDIPLAKEVFEELKEKQLAPALIVKLKTIESLWTEYNSYLIDGITVYQLKDLDIKEAVEPYLTRWIENLPTVERASIDRIFISNARDVNSDNNILGMYWQNEARATIILVWNNYFSNLNPLYWLMMLSLEYVFYHEIGHHNDQNRKEHTYLQAEKVADDYAWTELLKAHPLLRLSGRCGRWLARRIATRSLILFPQQVETATAGKRLER